MSQFAFGAGNMYVTQLQDALGNAVVNPTPYPLMVLQEGSVDFSGDIKELYGQNQFAVAVGRGKVKLTCKVKPARILAAVWNAIFFGQTLTSGLIGNFSDTAGIAVPATPFTVTIGVAAGSATTYQIPGGVGGVFVADLGVIDANGMPMKRVAAAPTTGQYSVNVGTGAYLFALADVGKIVYINYQYTSTAVATSNKQTVVNLPMGYAPSFKADLTVAYLGKLTTFSFPMCIANKMSMAFKNEDFSVPEFDFQAFDPGSGNVLSWSTSE